MTTRTGPLVATVDVGGTTIKGALVDAAGVVHEQRRTMVRDVAAQQIVPAIIGAFDGLLRAATGIGVSVSAVGLAVPGVVEENAGVGELSMILGWRDVPFVQLLQEAFGLPVAFSHDVSAGAYAEARRGAAQGHRDWLFLALGTGLGSTFVLNDRPYRGSGGTGGELAHVVCEADGPHCRCGKSGCLEMVSSAGAVATLYAQATGAQNVSAAEVVRRAADGDPAAQHVWHRAITGLVTVVGGYVESMNPSAIVIGGGLAEAGAALLEPFAVSLRQQVAFARTFPAIRAAAFGDLAAVHGIAIRAHEHLQDQHPGTFAVPFDGANHTVLPRRQEEPDGHIREALR